MEGRGGSQCVEKLGQWREDGQREASQFSDKSLFLSSVFAKERNYLKVTGTVGPSVACPLWNSFMVVMSVLRLARAGGARSRTDLDAAFGAEGLAQCHRFCLAERMTLCLCSAPSPPPPSPSPSNHSSNLSNLRGGGIHHRITIASRKG